MTIKNTYMGKVILAMLLLFLGIGLIFLPMELGMDGMDGGFALAFIGIWLAVTFFIVWLIFLRRYLNINKALSKNVLIGSFSYNADERDFLLEEQKGDIKLKRGMALFFLVLFSIIGLVVFLISGEEEMIFFLALMIGVGFFIYSMVWIGTFFENKKINGDYIATLFSHGVVNHSMNVVFDGKFVVFKKCKKIIDDGRVYLSIEIEAPIGRGFRRGISHLTILVPNSQLNLVDSMIEQLNSKGE